MNKKALVAAAIVVLLIIVAVVWYALAPPDTGKVIVIGAISPFTGDGANYGKAARTGIDLAVDEINAAGGVLGSQVEVQYEDDKGNPKDAVSAFQKLASVDNVPAVLGPFYSSNVLACAPVANRKKIVLVTGTATSDNIRDAGEFVFRVCPSNDEQARTIAEYALKHLNLETCFVLYRNVDYGLTLRNAFDTAFSERGGKIVGVEAVAPDANDVRAQLTKIKAAAPQFIFAAVHYPEGGAMLRQAREMGISTVVMGTDGGYDPQLLRIAGEAAEGSYWVTIGWGDESSNPAVASFKTAYKQRYGEEPGVYSGLFYDAAHILARAISAAKVMDGQGIQQAMFGVEYSGATGTTRFDDVGDVRKPFAVYRVTKGQFVLVPNQ